MTQYGNKDRIGAAEHQATLHKMLSQLEGLLDTSDLTQWQQSFVKSCIGWSECGVKEGNLSPKQKGIIKEIYDKHFA